jgi:hypothetical protein
MCAWPLTRIIQFPVWKRVCAGAIFPFAGIQVLLVNVVVVVAELVHGNVQQHERPCLRFREPTRNGLLQPVIQNSELLKNVLVEIEIPGPGALSKDRRAMCEGKSLHFPRDGKTGVHGRATL